MENLEKEIFGEDDDVLSDLGDDLNVFDDEELNFAVEEPAVVEEEETSKLPVKAARAPKKPREPKE